MLWTPLVGPELRAAVFRVLAATPGVQVNSHARDSLGRPAVEISGFDRVTSVTLATFEDPSTTRPRADGHQYARQRQRAQQLFRP